ncbi:MAG: hypothetical protein ACLFQS_04810 [Bacteroidales bacterium]
MEELREQLYESYILGEMDDWEQTIIEMERHYKQLPFSEYLYDLLLSRYGYIPYCLDNGKKEKAREHLSKAEKELEDLFKYNQYKSEAYSLRGAFLAFRISLSPLSAVRLGPRSYKAIDNAVETDSQDPTAWMEMGNTRFYTPSTFGGSKQEAAEYYERAIELFEKDLKPNQKWLYLNTLTGLAKSYQYLDKNNLSISIYEKALRFEPRFKWVKEELLPEAKKKGKQTQ